MPLKKQKRRLTAKQQLQAEQALEFVGPAVRAYITKNPSYRKAFRVIDAYSVARLAVTDAAKTYNPKRSQPTTYFSTAIRNALFREVQRFIRSKEGSDQRMYFPIVIDENPVDVQRTIALECLSDLPVSQRDLVERHILEGHSLLSIGQSIGRDWRTVRARINKTLELLQRCWEDDSISYNAEVDSSDDVP
jgi:RNA polymerase sigma factor (sigma-70 family)